MSSSCSGASLAVIQAQVMQAQVCATCSRLLLVRELVHRIVQHLIVGNPAHPEAIVAHMVLLVGASRVLRVAHLIHGHRMLSAAVGAAWLLAVALVPMAIVAVSVVPICSTMPVV